MSATPEGRPSSCDFSHFDKDRETMLNPRIRAAICEAIADVLQS